MIGGLLIFLFWVLFVLFTTIIIHESGHALVLKKFGQPHKIHFTRKALYFNLPSSLNDSQSSKVLLGGVIAGWINLFAWFLILPSSFGWLVILINAVIYWFGSRHDVKLFLFLNKQKI